MAARNRGLSPAVMEQHPEPAHQPATASAGASGLCPEHKELKETAPLSILCPKKGYLQRLPALGQFYSVVDQEQDVIQLS